MDYRDILNEALGSIGPLNPDDLEGAQKALHELQARFSGPSIFITTNGTGYIFKAPMGYQSSDLVNLYPVSTFPFEPLVKVESNEALVTADAASDLARWFDL